MVTYANQEHLRASLACAAARWHVATYEPVNYEVEIVPGLLEVENLRLVDFQRTGRRLVIVDENVEELYGNRIRKYLDANTSTHHLMSLPGGETNKNEAALSRVLSSFNSFGLRRRSEPVIAIGGGVLLDIVAFAASIYRRATPYVKVPTTLMGLVDAGIGVKTGINLEHHKNRVGTYEAPHSVLLDPSFLQTLPPRHISNGLAEILKIALIKDPALFSLLDEVGPEIARCETNWSSPTNIKLQILERAITGMLEELEPNLREHVLERKVDYGHTFSPVIEMSALPELLHGESVAIDMILTTVLAHKRGYLSEQDLHRIVSLTRQLGLPITNPVISAELLDQGLDDATAHRDGLQRAPLPLGIGACTFANDITKDELDGSLAVVRELDSISAEGARV